ncbi:Helix-loop-helix DNA-binding domain protein [Teladorsagia circumcincta]|uniref:Helix-loop-helix DNA-binding domain protein n=1 Tax=Teladorsagia circumcincta TaxID=45464 RepID=A0A2G9UGS6_TELCI|nr:Helix-loop-helix DNA-binding domain protein [Teladorsagia circumcincta]
MTRQSSTSSSPDENRRLRSTLKEKKRNIEINDAFEKLQRQLPHVPSSTRLPKIKTLRLALKYIEHLNTILSGDKQIMSDYMSNPRPLCVEDFAAVAMQEIQIRNSYTERARSEECANGNVRVSSSSPSQRMLSSSDSSPSHYQAATQSTNLPTVYLPQPPSYSHYQQSYFWSPHP